MNLNDLFSLDYYFFNYVKFSYDRANKRKFSYQFEPRYYEKNGYYFIMEMDE
jgi:hypothetical protein